MRVLDIALALEEFAPVSLQESYDNCGLQVGDMNAEINGVLVTLDVTESVVEEAIQRNCQMIVAHHPLIFGGLKRIANRTYVERTVRQAIKNDINIYAAHTNMDNVVAGVNAIIAKKLGLVNTTVLTPMKNSLYKLVTYAPLESAAKVMDAMFTAGAGSIGNYSECSFSNAGTGTFKANDQANPTIGVAGGPRELVNEVRIEVMIPRHRQGAIIHALKVTHPYEEVAYETIAVDHLDPGIGAGLVGELETPMDEHTFMQWVRQTMKADCIRHTELLGRDIHKVALCGGSGSFLLGDAIKSGADIFITGDFKYHQFFDADNKIVIADIGHYETEQYTPEIFMNILHKKFPTFAVLSSNVLTNPVKYFC